MEYMHLVGVEQVQSAANRMMEAANLMNRAANTIHEAVREVNEMNTSYIDRLDEIIKILDRIEGE